MNHAEAFSLEESYDAFPRIEAEFESALDASLAPRGPELLYELVQGLHLAPRANVLDVGCGEGRHSLATDRLEPREAAWLFAALGIAVGSTDPKRVDESIAAGGLRIDRRIDLGHDWATFNEERTGRSTRKLLHAARLLEDPDRYVARFGRSGYEIELGDCLWHVFHMIGKLTDRADLLSQQR